MRHVHWHILIDEPLSGAENMAVDHALMDRARGCGDVVVRIYGWRTPTLSLGRNQAAAGLYDPAKIEAAGVEIVRRPTGGRAVLHHREITYAVAARDDLLGAHAEAYARINRILVDALRRLGADASIVAPAGAAPAPSTSPCFEQPSAGEIVARGRKLVGSAQYRERNAVLQHGSILVDDDQHLAASLLAGRADLPPPASTLRELLGRAPSRADVAAAVGAAILHLEGRHPTIFAVDDVMRDTVRRLIVTYLDPCWTWRR